MSTNTTALAAPKTDLQEAHAVMERALLCIDEGNVSRAAALLYAAIKKLSQSEEGRSIPG
jgi:hypothetical protein